MPIADIIADNCKPIRLLPIFEFLAQSGISFDIGGFKSPQPLTVEPPEAPLPAVNSYVGWALDELWYYPRSSNPGTNSGLKGKLS